MPNVDYRNFKQDKGNTCLVQVKSRLELMRIGSAAGSLLLPQKLTTHSNRKHNQVNKLEKCLTSVREMLKWIEGNISRLMEIKIRTDENFECSLPSVVALEANDPFKWKTQPESFTQIFSLDHFLKMLFFFLLLCHFMIDLFQKHFIVQQF